MEGEVKSVSLRRRVGERLLATTGELPTSAFGRLRRFAKTAVGGGRLALSRLLRQDPQAMDFDTLVKTVTAMGELKGVTMKMGQILSYIDVALPPPAREALAALQNHAQPMPPAEVRRILEQELGEHSEEVLDGLVDAPLAAASIGQVHRARLGDGSWVAVKVQYPGIERAIAKDFGPAALGSQIASLIYPGGKIDGFIREARHRFLEECDYVHEAACHQRFADLYADHPTVLVPRLYHRFCSRRVLCSAFVEGQHMDEYLASGPSQADRDRLGKALFEFYVGSLFRYGLYNCDPHPGNTLFLPDGRLAVLDHGCSRVFDGPMVGQLADLSAAMQADNREQLHQALVQLDIVADEHDYDYAVARSLLRSFYGPMLRDEVLAFAAGDALSMREIVAHKGQMIRLGLPGEFLFLLRIRFGLASVLARLGARANWFRLEHQYVAEHRDQAAEARDPHVFDVVLLGSGAQEIQVIRELRDALAIELKDARALVVGVPRTIHQRLRKSEARQLVQRLEQAGAVAEIVETTADSAPRYPGASEDSENQRPRRRKKVVRGARGSARRR